MLQFHLLILHAFPQQVVRAELADDYLGQGFIDAIRPLISGLKPPTRFHAGHEQASQHANTGALH